MLRMSAWFSRRNRGDNNITTGNLANIRSERSGVARGQRKVHRRWDVLRQAFHRKDHAPNHVSSNAPQETVVNVSATCAEPDFDQKVRRIHSNLPITAIAQNQHTPGASGELSLEDSARLIVDHGHGQTPYPSSTSSSRNQVPGPEASGELIGTAPTKAKRFSTQSKDRPTKRLKEGEHGPDPRDLGVSADRELVQAESSKRQQLQKEVNELKAQLKIHESIAGTEKAKAAQYRQQWETLYQEVQHNHRIQAQWERQSQEYQATIDRFDAKTKELQEENFRLTSALRAKEEMLVEYRTDIARLSNERPDSKRDDHYFEQHFSKLFRSIQAWVLQYYLTVNPELGDLTNLHPLIQEFLKTTVPQEGLAILQSEPLYVIQAYIASQVESRVLSPILLGLMGDSYENIYKIMALHAGPEELTKWRISTINVISRGEDFLRAVTAKVEEVADELVTSLATLLPDNTNPQYKPGPRTRKLKVIVELAAKLALEVQQEPSAIRYLHCEPATACVASRVSDVKGLRNEVELQAIGTLVRLTVYPAVVRQPPNEREDSEVVLVKAQILVLGPSDQ